MATYTTDIYYYRDASHACDFMLYREGGKALPIQVCWQMSTEDTRQRELKGLLKACKITGRKSGIIISPESEDSFKMGDVNVSVIAAWKWCAQGFDLYGL